MSSFKEQLLKNLESLQVTPERIAVGLAQAVTGATVVERYDSKGRLVNRTVTRKPIDIVKGAMLYDAISGGTLGISPRELNKGLKGDVTEVAHRRLKVDDRIVAFIEEEEEEQE